MDHARVDQGGDPPLLRHPQDGAHRGRAASSSTTRSRSRRTSTPRACASCRRAWRATASFLEPGAIAHARLREHRRARRRGHDGRHVGDGRLVRADRARLPPRRAASASAACSSLRARSRSSSRTACFVGSRAVVVEGVRVGREAVIGAGVVLTASTAILDVSGPEVVEHRGRVPPRSVVIPGVAAEEVPRGRVRRARARSSSASAARAPTAR